MDTSLPTNMPYAYRRSQSCSEYFDLNPFPNTDDRCTDTNCGRVSGGCSSHRNEYEVDTNVGSGLIGVIQTYAVEFGREGKASEWIPRGQTETKWSSVPREQCG